MLALTFSRVITRPLINKKKLGLAPREGPRREEPTPIQHTCMYILCIVFNILLQRETHPITAQCQPLVFQINNSFYHYGKRLKEAPISFLFLFKSAKDPRHHQDVIVESRWSFASCIQTKLRCALLQNEAFISFQRHNFAKEGEIALNSSEAQWQLNTLCLAIMKRYAVTAIYAKYQINFVHCGTLNFIVRKFMLIVCCI